MLRKWQNFELMQYRWSRANRRGRIQKLCKKVELAELADVKELQFSPQTATLSDTAEITDDPLFSQTALVTLPKGTTVYYLASMGDLAYVECNAGDPVRGFVHRDLISVGMVYDLSDFPSNGGDHSLNGTITIVGNHIEVEIDPVVYQNEKETSVSGFLVYNNLSGDLLLTADTVNENGAYVGSAALTESTTSLLIEPVYPDDPSIEQQALVILEW